MRSAARRSSKIFQLKITLRDIHPPIWRRVLVPGHVTLLRLHHVIQDALGWTNSHLHQFFIDGGCYGTPSVDLDLAYDGDERRLHLEKVVAEGDAFSYEYDFGDGWNHAIEVEQVRDPRPDENLLVCTAGARACPPEDCGGTGGYADLLLAIKDPRHPDHLHLRKWAGPYDPEAFDLEETNARLRKHRT